MRGHVLVAVDLGLVGQGFGDRVEPAEQPMAVRFGDFEAKTRRSDVLVGRASTGRCSLTVWSRRSMVTAAVPGCSRPAAAIAAQSAGVELDHQQSVLKRSWTQRYRRIRHPLPGAMTAR